MLTLATYHYVRPIPDRRGFRMRGRSVEQFEAQVDALARSHEIIGLPELVAHLRQGAPLPAKAAMLTFDDGVVDHVEWVFPALRKRRLPGLFFVTADAVRRSRMLPVHQIHHLLASGWSSDALLAQLFKRLAAYREVHDTLPSDEELRRQYAVPGEWDDAATMCLKRLLQRELPEAVRDAIADELFRSYIADDVLGFADEFYLSTADIQRMIDGGMYFGGHGASHRWLTHLPEASVRHEIEQSRLLLDGLLKGLEGGWSFSYPYGAHDDRTVALLREAGCSAAFTGIRQHCADPVVDPLRIPRLDTNDLPVS